MIARELQQKLNETHDFRERQRLLKKIWKLGQQPHAIADRVEKEKTPQPSPINHRDAPQAERLAT